MERLPRKTGRPKYPATAANRRPKFPRFPNPTARNGSYSWSGTPIGCKPSGTSIDTVLIGLKRPWPSNGIPLGPFNGIMDEVRIAEGALNPQQIMTEYLSETDNLLKYGEQQTYAIPAERRENNK